METCLPVVLVRLGSSPLTRLQGFVSYQSEHKRQEVKCMAVAFGHLVVSSGGRIVELYNVCEIVLKVAFYRLHSHYKVAFLNYFLKVRK